MRKISERKRVVVKVGTSTLTHRTGRLNIRRVENLVKTLADLQNAGRVIVLVSSGAIALGMGKLGMTKRPQDTPGKQACAAVGQCELNECMPRHRISVRCANKTFLIAQTNYLYCLVRLSQLATFTSFHYSGTQ